MTLVVISREYHAGKRLLPQPSYEHARSVPLVPLCGAELSLAAQEFPICFASDGAGITPAALLYPEPGGNAFVGADGSWLASYIPAAFRAYPFALARKEGTDEMVLCLHEAAALSDTDGEPLFTESGEPGAVVLKARDFFIEIERNRAATAVACAALAKRNLLVPWPLQIDKGDGNTVSSPLSLLKLDEAAFNALDEPGVAELWQAGAFPVAYAHMLSLGRMAHLGRMIAAQRPQQAQPQAKPPVDLDRVFGITTNEAELHFNF